jgi:hypothetical protein
LRILSLGDSVASEIQAEMIAVWDEAHLLLMSMRLDPTQAIEMMRKLLHYADQARDAGYLFAERHLRRAAFDLQERMKQPS